LGSPSSLEILLTKRGFQRSRNKRRGFSNLPKVQNTSNFIESNFTHVCISWNHMTDSFAKTGVYLADGDLWESEKGFQNNPWRMFHKSVCFA
jgi:hypothetical protein